MTGPLIEFVDVSIARHREYLLSRVSLQVGRGAVHVIVGPNGAGKTTLLAALLGQIPFDGRIVVHWQRDGRIGYVPQTFVVDPEPAGDGRGFPRVDAPAPAGLLRRQRRRAARASRRC